MKGSFIMKRKYETPVFERIVFDYTVQTVTSTTDCFESVMNVKESGESAYNSACVGGTPISVGWTDPQTGV